MNFVQQVTVNQQDQNIQAEHHVHDSSTLIKVNADITENKKTMAIWCSFFFIVGLIYLLTFALPSTFITKIDNDFIGCPQEFIMPGKGNTDDNLQYICRKFSVPYTNSITKDLQEAKQQIIFQKQENMYYGGLIRSMSKMNQFLIVNLLFQKKSGDISKIQQQIKHRNKEINVVLPFQGHFYLLDGDLKIDEKFDTKQDHRLEINCPAGQPICDDTQILYYSKLYDSNYAFVIQFTSDPKTWPLSEVIHYSFINLVLLILQREYVNQDYTGFLLAMRYTCLFVSIVMCFAYIKKLQRINSSHWVIEQRLIVVLSGLLVLFNNPFYALTILFPNMASQKYFHLISLSTLILNQYQLQFQPFQMGLKWFNKVFFITLFIYYQYRAFFEVMFIVNFFVFLLTFYLVILDRVIKENGSKESKALDKKKIAFGILLYFFFLLTYIGFSYNHLEDPYTDFQDSFGGFYEFCKWGGIVLLIFYFCAIFYLYIKVFTLYNQLIWRNRLFSLFSLYYIVCAGISITLPFIEFQLNKIITLIKRYIIKGVERSNKTMFIFNILFKLKIVAFSGSLDIYNSIGGRALLFITILNLYVYYLQYMYSFSPQGFQEAEQIINLEVGNRPQIYEVLDDSLHGIELASQNGDGINNQKLNNNQAQEHMLAQDIFQQHQILNQMKAPEEKETNTLTGSKSTPGNYYNDNQQSNNNHQYQQDLESNKPYPKQNKGNQPDENSEDNQSNQQQDQEQNDGDLVINFDKQQDEDEEY